MAEISYYWDGTTTGDATSAPYTAALYTTNWKKLFTRVDDEGVVDNYENELEVSGISGGVVINTGAALVEGYFYENTAQETVTIPTPTTDPRIDRIVLRKDPIAQTVRVYRIAGTENPAPTAPALTQTAGGIFEVPLAQVLITTAGAITVTDERDYPHTPLIPIGIGIAEIETIESDGTLTSFDFQNIPQTYRHLLLVGCVRGTINSTRITVFLNGDSINTNYQAQELVSETSPLQVTAIAANASGSFLVLYSGMIANEPVALYIDIPFYISSFYKTVLGNSTASQSDFEIIDTTHILWQNTDPIDQITLELNSGVFVNGSRFTLYGQT